MNNFKKHPIIKSLASIKVTVVCLILFFILTLWGTIAQVQDGLYLAQKQFFFSWFFLGFGFLPFPGAKLVLWVLFINLVCVSITRFVYKWSHVGILIIHLGILSYLISAFVTYNVTEESQLTLLEGEGSNVSQSYHDWELSFWKADDNLTKKVTAIDANYLVTGQNISLPQIPLTIAPQVFYKNADALMTASEKSPQTLINASGIRSLVSKPFHKEPEQNFPGGIFEITSSSDKQTVLLYGGESEATSIEASGQPYALMLRRKRIELPFVLTLKRFDMEFHPGTEIARSYQSLVEIEHEGLKREILIYMNHPLRYKDYTLYQASYSIDQMGRERSTLAVVKNSGRLLPYISTFLTFGGLAWHFLVMAFRNKKTHP
jgi:hypothetical protein